MSLHLKYSLNNSRFCPRRFSRDIEQLTYFAAQSFPSLPLTILLKCQRNPGPASCNLSVAKGRHPPERESGSVKTFETEQTYTSLFLFSGRQFSAVSHKIHFLNEKIMACM